METELYLSLLTAIIGMSYPILLQLISTLDEKYESERIVSVFRNERIYKYFEATMSETRNRSVLEMQFKYLGLEFRRRSRYIKASTKEVGEAHVSRVISAAFSTSSRSSLDSMSSKPRSLNLDTQSSKNEKFDF